MREAIGGSWLFGLVITFIVFFASFLALSINYSKAFNVKNNVVDFISKYEGNNTDARDKIADYLKKVGYLVPGDCSSVFDGATCIRGYRLDGSVANPGEKAYYCVMKGNTNNSSSIPKHYYSAAIFFKIDLPVIGNLIKLNIKGDTEAIYFPNDDMTGADCP